MNWCIRSHGFTNTLPIAIIVISQFSCSFELGTIWNAGYNRYLRLFSYFVEEEMTGFVNARSVSAVRMTYWVTMTGTLFLSWHPISRRANEYLSRYEFPVCYQECRQSPRRICTKAPVQGHFHLEFTETPTSMPHDPSWLGGSNNLHNDKSAKLWSANKQPQTTPHLDHSSSRLPQQ